MINHHSDDNWHKILLSQRSVIELPTLSQLANVLLTLNAENATVERSFSLMSRLQTPTRNRSLSSTADKLMRLKLIAASCKTFNHDRPYALWLQSSTRSRCNVSGTVSTEPEVNKINTYIIHRAGRFLTKQKIFQIWYCQVGLLIFITSAVVDCFLLNRILRYIS